MFPRLLGSGLFVTCILVLLYGSGSKYLQQINFSTTDLILQFGKKERSGQKLVVVDIDEESLLRYGQWPWPRYRVAELLRRINAGQPAQIGVNIIFAEEDRNSPEIWQKNLAKDFGQYVDLSQLPEKLKNYDNVLADVVNSGPFVLSYAFVFGKQQGTPLCNPPEMHIMPAGMDNAELDQLALYEPDDAICSRDVIARAASGAGFLNAATDADGIVRRLPLLMKYNGRYYPSFALAMVQQGIPEISDSGFLFRRNDLQIPELIAGRHRLPLDENGQIMLGQVAHAVDLHLSAADILADKVDLQQVRDALVLVGTTATGLTKDFATPFAHQVSELELTAQFVKTMLSGDVAVRAPYFLYCEILASFILLGGIVVCSRKTTAVRAGSSCMAGIAVTWLGTVLVYRNFGYLLSPLLPTVTVVINCCMLTSIRFYYYQREAKREAGDALLLLQSNEITLQSILRAIPDIVFRLDRNGNIVFISPAISRYVEKPETLLGQSIFSLIDPEDMEKAWGRINERRTGDRATEDLEIRLHFTLRSKNPRDERFFRVRAEGLYQDLPSGEFQFVGTQGIIRDITEQKKLESQLVRAQKMEAIGSMAAGIAHDLNNILSGLVSYPELLLLEVPKDSPMHQKISVIHKSGKKAAAIVQDLLFLARRGVAVSEIVSVNEVIRDYLASAEFEQICRRHEKSSVVSDLAEDVANIEGSPVHLAKVVMNLVHNGLEAMPAGGELVIATRNVELADDYFGYEPIPPGRYVCISVKDHGVGMSPENVLHVFEPFYTKKSLGQSGTGLGMTVIFSTIKDHGGYIDVESEEGSGSSITIYLPVTEKRSVLVEQGRGLEELVGDECLLVVDDVEAQLEIATNILTKLGYRVLAAESGEKAVEIYKKEAVDLVVLDMIMPGGMDGLETFEQLQQLDPNVRAIITSGHSETERVARLQQLGAGMYVQKPYTLEALGVAIRVELKLKR